MIMEIIVILDLSRAKFVTLYEKKKNHKISIAKFKFWCTSGGHHDSELWC